MGKRKTRVRSSGVYDSNHLQARVLMHMVDPIVPAYHDKQPVGIQKRTSWNGPVLCHPADAADGALHVYTP